MDKRFIKCLEREIGLRDKIPSDAFWLFDYHLDWIAVALKLLKLRPSISSFELKDGLPEAIPNELGCIHETKNMHSGPLVRGSQQDADLLIAFDTTVILVEAKAAGSWSRSQMDGKIERMDELHCLAGEAGIELLLVLCSPSKTGVHLENESDWPKWATPKNNGKEPFHIELPFGDEGKPFSKPSRTNPDPKGSKNYRDVRFVKQTAKP